MIQLKVNNIFVDIIGDFPSKHWRPLEKKLSFRPQGYQFSPAFNRMIYKDGKVVRRMWDGWKHQIWKNKKRFYFPTGLYSLVQEYFKENNIPFKTKDTRTVPSQELDLSWSKEFKLRPYQSQIIDDSCNRSRGIIHAATGSGKTVIAAGIISKLQVAPFIFFVTSIDLLVQSKESLEAILSYNNSPLEVGQIGGGVIDIKDVNVMTVQTAVRALGQSWDKKTKFDDEDTEDKTPIEDRKKDIIDIIKSSKGVVSDEIQHWRADTCQLVSKSLSSAYYTFGLSVSPESYVVIKDSEGICTTTIENLYYNQRKCSTLSVDKLCHPSWKKITNVVRHRPTSKLIRVKTKFGQMIDVTESHSVFILDEDWNLACKKGSEIKKNDILISPWINQSGQDKSIDIAKHMVESDKDSGKGIWFCGYFPELEEHIKKDVDSNVRYRYFRRKPEHYIPCNVVKKFNLWNYISKNKFYIRSGKNGCFSRFINSEDLCYLTGLVLGNGDINKTRLGITLGKKSEYTTVSEFMKRFDIKEQLYRRGKVFYVRYNNAVLVRFLKTLGLNTKCCKKFIPPMIFDFGVNSHRALVKGLLLSDGHVQTNKERRKEQFSYTTRSSELAGGIHYLFMMHGSLLGINRSPTNTKFQDRVINSSVSEEFTMYCSTSSSILLDNSFGFKYNSNKVPVTERILKMIAQASIDKTIKNKLMKRVYISLSEYNSIVPTKSTWKDDIPNNFRLLPVTNVSSIPEPDFVYDLSVEKNENFFANGLLVHNSATPYRDEGDDMMIQACFGKKIAEVTASQLIRDDWLIKPSIKMVHIKKQKSVYKQWQSIYQDQITENEYYNGVVSNIANSYVKHGRMVLVLVRQIKHGKLLESMIPDSLFLSGKSSKKDRIEGIRSLRRKEISCIVSSTIFDEGIDIKPLDTVILAGQGRSKTRAMQRIGRILRPFEGKTTATAIDFYVHQKYLKDHAKSREKMYKTEPEYDVEDIDIGDAY